MDLERKLYYAFLNLSAEETLDVLHRCNLLTEDDHRASGRDSQLANRFFARACEHGALERLWDAVATYNVTLGQNPYRGTWHGALTLAID